MNKKETDGLYLARKQIAAFMARAYPGGTAVGDMSQELVHSFNVITEILRAEETGKFYELHYYDFASWWKIVRGISEPESMLR